MNAAKTVAILGVGLIGGSIGLAVRRRWPEWRVVGVGRNRSRLEEARTREAVTDVTTDLSQGVAAADWIVVCTPVERIAEHVLEVAAHCPRHAIITDAGSTKATIVRRVAEGWSTARAGAPAPSRESTPAAESSIPTADSSPPSKNPSVGPLFIGSHPIAGSEKAGVAAARADLFDGRVVIMTPDAATPAAASDALADFWRSLGADVRAMSPEEHDEALAFTSHLPHLVAAALAASTPRQWLSLAAGGWSDTTRIAAGDAELWRQILATNADHALKSLDEFAKKLDSFRRALADDDQDALRQLLQAGKTNRDALGS